MTIRIHKLALIIGLSGVLAGGGARAATLVLRDTYNVVGSGSGFDLDGGVNSGINPPATRLTGSAASGLAYINTGTKVSTAYAIISNKLEVASAANPGRFVFSLDRATSFDFGPVLGASTASATNPAIYDLSITINNGSTGTQRASFALGTTEGDANTWAFGFQIYRTNSADNFYAIAKRVDTGASGLTNDLNELIKTLTPNTYADEITVLMRVTDAGAESASFHSRVQLSLNGGNSWFYDTVSDPDLPNGWRLNAPGRHMMWDIAPNAGPVTYDKFSLTLDPPASNANTGSVFRVMTYNIHSGRGPDNKVNTQRIANYILEQNLDLVALNEVTRFMPRGDGRDLIGELSEQTGMSYVFSNTMPDLTGNDQFGNAILSKFPILARDFRFLPRLGSNEQRGWIKAIVDVNGKFLSFWATHLAFVADDTERLMCVTNFNTWVGEETFPVVLGGDFNETPDKNVHAVMEKKWDDIWPLAGSGLGRTAPCPGPLNARIDYLWKAQKSPLVPTNAFVGYALEASDHYPELTQFVWTNFTTCASGFYLAFDQGRGTKVTDTVGGLAGSFSTDAPTWSTESPTGQTNDFSLFFAGANKISIPDPVQIIGTNGWNDNYTLQAWVKLPVNFVPASRMVLFQYERRPGFSLSINTNRTLHTTAFKIKDISSSATLPNDGLWHHVAVVHTDGLNMRFYIDATLAATVAYTGGAGFRTSSAITIGSAENDSNGFTGYLDRVSFDNVALESAEFDYPAAPHLAIRKNGNSLRVSWPAGKIPYVLQINSSLQSTGWTTVPVQLQGQENQTIVPLTNSTQFYRLKK